MEKVSLSGAKHELRMDYLQRIFAERRLKGNLRYCVFTGGTNYDDMTIRAIARAIAPHLTVEPSVARVYVDALSRTKRRSYMQGLRLLGVSVKDVRGIAKDENDALTRLADALAGFVRDALEDTESEMARVLNAHKRQGIVVEV